MASRTYIQVKRADKAAGTRKRILAAARAALTDHGALGTSVEDIAERAGVTRKTVYERFGTKAGLLRSLVDEIVARQDIEVTVEELVALPSAEAALRGFVDMAVRIWEEEMAVLSALLLLAETDTEAGETLDYANAGRRKDATTIVTRLGEDGRLGDGWSRRRAADLLWTATSFETFDFIRRRGGRSFAASLDLVHDMAGALLTAQQSKRRTP